MYSCSVVCNKSNFFELGARATHQLILFIGYRVHLNSWCLMYRCTVTHQNDFINLGARATHPLTLNGRRSISPWPRSWSARSRLRRLRGTALHSRSSGRCQSSVGLHRISGLFWNWYPAVYPAGRISVQKNHGISFLQNLGLQQIWQ